VNELPHFRDGAGIRRLGRRSGADAGLPSVEEAVWQDHPLARATVSDEEPAARAVEAEQEGGFICFESELPRRGGQLEETTPQRRGGRVRRVFVDRAWPPAGDGGASEIEDASQLAYEGAGGGKSWRGACLPACGVRVMWSVVKEHDAGGATGVGRRTLSNSCGELPRAREEDRLVHGGGSTAGPIGGWCVSR
jgi:hypothetical protein